ncbi:hypothetical protein SCARD494_09401 [Seiridium cardinale]
MANPRDVEILVHIAAPSKASDDTKYRSLAAAYIKFQPQEPLTPLEPVSLTRRSTAATFTTSREDPGPSQRRTSNEALIPDDYHSSLQSLQASFQASFQSAIDNANSPLHLAGKHLQTPDVQKVVSQNTASQSSWRTPPGLVQDSIPENDATTTLLTTPTRVLEHYLQNFHTPSQTSRELSQRRGAPKQKVSHDPAVASTQESSGQDSEAQGHLTIPCTPGDRLPQAFSPPECGETLSEQPQSSQSQRDHAQDTQTTGMEEDVVEDTILIIEPETPPVARADSEPPPSKRHRQDKSDASPAALLRTWSDISAKNRKDGSIRTITFFPVHGYGHHSLELHPPDPFVGCGSMAAEDLITPALEELAGALRTSKRYMPESTTRELRPFERGFWSVDCTGWPQDLKTETWMFLANHIGTGLAGWGVSCRRDQHFTWLRFYCWGFIVGHIYLLLYLASRRRICHSDATWIDGEGERVVNMGKKDGVWIRM